MSSDPTSESKFKHREKSKVRNIKKKQTRIDKTSEIRKVRKISEKYLKDEVQVESSLKLRQANVEVDDYGKQKQNEIDFFCDPFSSVQVETKVPVEINEEKESDQDDEISQKSEPHSARSNESPNTHLASTYVGHEYDPVIEKFELTRISFDELELLFRPRVERLVKDEEKGLKPHEHEGFFVPDPPVISNPSNTLLLLDRLQESGSTELIDSFGCLKNFHKLIDDDVYKLVCDKTFTPIYVPPMPMTFDSIDKIISEKKFLKIYISHMTFDQHYLFTNEHHIAKLVEKLFSEYERRKKMDFVGTLRNKLNNLRQVKSENYPTTTDGAKSARTIRNEELALNHQIKNVRKKLHVEEKYDRMVLKNLLENWKNLKTVRNQQGYSLTDITLKIQKHEIDLAARQTDWQQRYDAELNEMIAEEFDDYQGVKQKYKDFIKSVNDPDSIADLQEVINKPRKPDIDKIVANLNEIYDEIPFNEPELNIIVSNNYEDKEKSTKPKEKLKKIGKFSYRFELEVDGEIVGSTKLCKLDEDFSLLVQSAFILKLTKQVPEQIKLLIFETKSATRKLSEILIPLPDDDEYFSDTQEVDFEFSSKRLERKNSRTRLSSFRKSSNKKVFNISGRVCVKMGWTSGDVDDQSDDVKILRKRNARDKPFVSHDVLKKWFDSNLLNPLDPDAEHLVKFVKQGSKEDMKLSDGEAIEAQGNLFRFNEEELAFCSKEELDSIERFHLLKARHNKDLNYRNKKLIPQSERELEFDKDKDMNIIDESSIADPIDLQRYRGRKYLKKVYETISNHCEILNRDKMNTNILIGDDVPTLESLSLAFLGMFGPKRPLKPIRRMTSSRASYKLTDVTNFNIVVMVVRATNVPIRSEEPTQTSSRKSSSTIAVGPSKFTPFKSFNTYPHVFVTISLKDLHNTSRTSSAEEGTNPTWNEQLTLPYNLNTDAGKKILSIDLYDEVVEDLIDNVTEVYQRITSKWLGTIKISIANIFANQRIEGTFEVSVPTVLLGYTKPKFTRSDVGSHSAASLETFPHMSKKTHINLFISLEPNAEIPQLISSGLECIEVEGVERQIRVWYEQLKLEFPSRANKWSPLVTLLTGKRACITRLLHPLKFPFEKNAEVAEFQIRRFVSLIPVQNDVSASNTSCSGLNGVWLSNTHVLGLMTSSNKDLGVLLTCFYLELGYPSWLIVGSSITCGECCFVLTRESNEFFIIDPSSGKKYSSKDIHCPLMSCYCLVNQYNVWANVQREQRIFMMQFDVNKGFDWRPLFQKVIDIPNETIHDLSFNYERSFDTRDLQRMIQTKVVKKINSWRSHRKTIWNRFVSENLKQILLKLEDDVCFENEVDDHVEMLRALYVNYKITGFTINTKYTNLSSIVTQIKNTGIHLNLDNKVEFASSVFVKEYANNVISIWIFLMSLVSKI